jgi:polysaccharide export outer membrane protein
MKIQKLVFYFGCGIALVMLSSGCKVTGPKFDARAPRTVVGTALTNELNSSWLQSNDDFFTVGPGDSFELKIVGNEGTSTVTTVGPDGKIYFYILPGLDVWGLKLSEVKKLLQDELSKYVTGAQVSIALRTVGSKSIWMLGRVSSPGIYPMTGPTTLLEAVAKAGGLAKLTLAGGQEDQADLRHSFVQRRGELVPVNFERLFNHGDMSQNIYLQPDDFVYLPSSTFHEIFVLGTVRNPRSMPYGERMTLLKAIAAAGGPRPGAYKSHVAIVRGSMAEPSVAIVDYQDIAKGRMPDVLLEPHDIVYVPDQPFLELKNYADRIFRTIVNSVAANEGVNLVSESGERVGISVPPVPVSR